MVAKPIQPGQLGGPAAPSRFVQVEFYWRVILQEEPETNPWEFACKMRKCKLITNTEIWDVAEWADAVREDVRLIRLREIARSAQKSTGSKG